MNADLVVFRKWKDIGRVIALFPTIPSDPHGYYCEAYEQVGQHGGADYHGVIAHSVPATAEEYASLANELTRIGYHVMPIKRASSCLHDRRRETARAWRSTNTQ